MDALIISLLDVQSLVDGIGKNISSFSKMFPLQSCLSNFTIFISHSHAKIEDHYPEIDKMDFYRYTDQKTTQQPALNSGECSRLLSVKLLKISC